MARTGLLGTPVNLGDDDGVGIDDGHLIVELVDFVPLGLLQVGLGQFLVLAAVPAVVVVDGIANVVARDGIGLIVGIAGLPARAGHPDDAGEAVGADEVDNGLEIVVHGLLVVGVLRVPDAYRLVGQLDADLSGILADGVVLGEEVPDVEQVLLVVVAHLQVARTDPRRADDDVQAVLHGPLYEWEVERLHVVGEARGVEVLDVGLAAGISGLSGRTGICIAVVVGPCRFQVQAEDCTLRLLEGSEQFLEIIEAALAAGIVVAPAPAAVIEPGTRRVHHAVKHHVVAVGVDQPLSFHMERGQRLHALCSECCAGHEAHHAAH